MTTTSDRGSLAARLGVVVPDGLADELAATLADNAQIALDGMVSTGEVGAAPDPRLAAVALPRSVAEVLTVAIADARARGDAAHEMSLRLSYLDALPRARLVQFLCDRAPHRWLLHAPVPWDHMPRFVRGLERLFDLMAEHGLDPTPIGATSAATFLAARPTLADLYLGTYYGSLLPMFGATEHDLARLERDVTTAPERRWELVDRRLANALLHEILHFGRAREAIFPPYLDEAIAAHFGLSLDPRVAYPIVDDDGALVGWPWFSQVGAALARAVGDGPLLAAQAGLRPWSEVIPEELLARLESEAWAAYRARPAVHFHPDTTRPDRWVALIYALVPPRSDDARDARMLVHALTATCLHAEQVDGAWNITRRAPDGPVTIDFAAGVVRAPPRRDGWEPAPMIHALPPSLVAPWPARTMSLDPTPAAIEASARAILDARPGVRDAVPMRVAIAQYDGATSLRVLPLAAGLLASTLRRAPDLLDVPVTIVRRRVDPDVAAEALAGHAVVGLSLYTWNERYTLEVARRLRALSPATLIVAGGPSVPRRPDDAERYLAEHAALDVLVAGEGERALLEIVRARRAGSALDTIAGTTTRGPDGVGRRERGPRLVGADFAGPERGDAALVGSPYLDGTFDALLASPDDTPASAAVFETNRGCPFSCTFCDWGQAIESRVHELPFERVMAELAWAAERQIPFLYFIDANFGIRKRDVDIVRALGDIARRTGFPRFVFFHLTKNATDKNLATVEALREAGIETQVSLSMQDFDPDVLAAIRRDNIHPERALELRARAHAQGLPTNNELMLGLPAQTGPGFRRSLVQALTPFPGDSFFLFMTRVLVNAELADPSYRARWGLVVREVPTLPRDASEVVHVVERELVVVGSDAMPIADWRSAFTFGFLFAALVNQGLLASTLRLMRYTLGVDVVDAVERLSVAETPVLSTIRGELHRFADAVLDARATALPLDGFGPTRREPTEAVCAAALARSRDFQREAFQALTPMVAAGDLTILGEAIAWDALHLPQHGTFGRETFTFTRDWWDWSPSDGRPPAPTRLVVHRTAPPWASERPEAWLDNLITLGWSKAPRVRLERA